MKEEFRPRLADRMGRMPAAHFTVIDDGTGSLAARAAASHGG